MGRPMGLLEAGEDVDNMLGEIRVEAEYRAVVRRPHDGFERPSEPLTTDRRRP